MRRAFAFVPPNLSGYFPFHSNVSYQQLMFSTSRRTDSAYGSQHVQSSDEMEMKGCHVAHTLYGQISSADSIPTKKPLYPFVQSWR